MRKVSLVIIYAIIPILILVIGYHYFHDVNEQFTHEKFYKVLFFYFPALFSTQGFLIALTKTKLIIPFVLICTSYSLVLIFWLNSSNALGNFPKYAIIWFLGFGVVKFFTGRVVVE